MTFRAGAMQRCRVFTCLASELQNGLARCARSKQRQPAFEPGIGCHDQGVCYTTAFRRAASLYQAALSLGVRFCVSKSTYTIPKRVP